MNINNRSYHKSHMLLLLMFAITSYPFPLFSWEGPKIFVQDSTAKNLRYSFIIKLSYTFFFLKQNYRTHRNED